jgi:hypothetical protein
MPQKPFYRHCLKCNIGFSTFEEAKIWCGDVCEFRYKTALAARNPAVTRKTARSVKCPGCDVYFIPRTNQIYCHQYCRAEYNNKIAKEKTFLAREEKTCPVCKELFKADKTIKYCSNACRHVVNHDKLNKFNAKRRADNAKAGKKKSRLPYHVLNRMAEQKRLDEEWHKLTK